ncbi:MAG: class I SAM-dependent methyltransferase [archaeon]
MATFDRNAYKYCGNITDSWDWGVKSIGFSDEELGRRILDVGCGCVGAQLSEYGHLFGIDPNLGIMRFNGDGEVARYVRPAVPSKSLRALAEELPFKDESFDFAYSTKAVGWYPKAVNTEMALREMLRVVKKDTGVIVFNIGQEMTKEIINSALLNLHQEGYGANTRYLPWITMWHKENVNASGTPDTE